MERLLLAEGLLQYKFLEEYMDNLPNLYFNMIDTLKEDQRYLLKVNLLNNQLNPSKTLLMEKTL